MIPKVFTEGQMAEVRKMASYRKYLGRCPCCRDTGVYTFKGVEYVCEEDHFGHLQERLLVLYLLNAVPSEHMRLAWEDYPWPAVVKKVNAYVDTFDRQLIQGMGFDFFGPLGVGKTWAATRIQREVCKMGHSTYHIDFKRLKNLFETGTPESRDKIKRHMLDSVLLVIDDIVEPPSDLARAFYEDKLEEIIRTRAHDGLPTVTTTNMTEDEFVENFPRVSSVLSGKQYKIDFDGLPDGRVEAYKKREADIENEETDPIE